MLLELDEAVILIFALKDLLLFLSLCSERPTKGQGMIPLGLVVLFFFLMYCMNATVFSHLPVSILYNPVNSAPF